MSALTAFTVPGAGAPGSFVTTEPIGELEFERTAARRRVEKDRPRRTTRSSRRRPRFVLE
jgi:hypothetical protein